MTIKTSVFALLTFFLMLGSAVAQEAPREVLKPALVKEIPKDAPKTRKNILKINVLPILLKNISLQYELAVTPKSSVALGFSYLPERSLPPLIVTADTSGILESFVISGFSITPEFRLYLTSSKEAPQGFYLAPYFRFRNSTIETLIPYNDPNTGALIKKYPVHASYNTYGAGAMIGIQKIISERFFLDWWIGGAHFGSSNTSVTISEDLSKVDKIALKKQLDAEAKKEYGSNASTYVDNKGATLNITGQPFLEIRFGLCIGYSF